MLLFLVGSLVFSGFLIYRKILAQSALLLYDDSILIFPYRYVKTMGEYISAVNNGYIYDRQPVRDLSYWLEYRLYDLTGYFNTHVTNFMIWVGIVYLAYLLAEKYIKNDFLLKIYILLIVFHPLPISSIAWSASRKHLLSTLFILGATNLLMSYRYRWQLFLLCFLYLFALLSQPINILWPFAAILLLWSRERYSFSDIVSRFFLMWLTLGLISIAVAYWNYAYYMSPDFIQLQGGSKYIVENLDIIAARFLVLGRYFINSFFPIYVSSSSYEPIQIKSIIGFLFLMIFILMTRRDLFQKKYLGLWALSLLGIFFMTVKITVHAGWDTYAILFVLVAPIVLIQEYGKLFSNRLFYSCVLLFFFTISSSHVRSFYSDINYWVRAYQTDANLFNKTKYAQASLNYKINTEEVIKIIGEIQHDYPNYGELGYLVAKFIVNHVGDPAKQLEELKKNYMPQPWYLSFLALSYMDNQEYQKVIFILHDLFTFQPEISYNNLKPQLKTLKLVWEEACRKSPEEKEKCSQIDRFIPEQMTNMFGATK